MQFFQLFKSLKKKNNNITEKCSFKYKMTNFVVPPRKKKIVNIFHLRVATLKFPYFQDLYVQEAGENHQLFPELRRLHRGGCDVEAVGEDKTPRRQESRPVREASC